MNAIAVLIVLLCWPVYLLLFLKKGALRPQHHKNDRTSVAGILLQGAGVFLVFYFRRSAFTPIIPFGFAAIVLAVGAVWFSRIALDVLGEQWAFLAGVKAEHRLVQTGPYSVVRHPLYVCFFALVIATGVVWTMPWVLPMAIGIFSAGMWIRIRTEERLLRAMFSEEFDDYSRRVPSVVPRRSTGP